MKITDLYTLIQKGSAGSDAGKAARLIQPVQPVGHVGRLSLVPGQLIQGEVVGEDVNGLLLLKLAGEIISARTPVKLEPGQQFWFEVKDAGASPLLTLASQKGAIQDLLKDIVATRPLLVKDSSGPGPSPPLPPASGQGQVPVSSAAEGMPQSQPAVGAGEIPSVPAGQQAVSAAAVLGADGSLPPEAARLVRALVASLGELGSANGHKDNGVPQAPALIRTIVSLVREGQIPADLLKNEAFQDVVRPRQSFASSLIREAQSSVAGAPQKEQTSALPVDNKPPDLPQAPSMPKGISPPGPALLAPETIKILNGLLAVAGIKAPLHGESGPLQPALNPDQNLAEILTVIAREDRLPVSLHKLAPLQLLLNSAGKAAAPKTDTHQAGIADRNELSEQGLSAAKAMLPLQFAAAQQGADSLPSQLRLLAALMGLGARSTDIKAWQDVEEMLGRLSEKEMPLAARKLASFFEAHTRVNTEAAPQGQSDFYIMPALFSGQAGWGEWLWSREGSVENNDSSSQENLVFFLEMSNLGALTIQVILKGKKLRGQILMADKKGSEFVALLLPGLQERLEAFGYDVMDLACSCQPLNVMQELKESLHNRAGSGPVSLLDVQA